MKKTLLAIALSTTILSSHAFSSNNDLFENKNSLTAKTSSSSSKIDESQFDMDDFKNKVHKIFEQHKNASTNEEYKKRLIVIDNPEFFEGSKDVSFLVNKIFRKNLSETQLSEIFSTFNKVKPFLNRVNPHLINQHLINLSSRKLLVDDLNSGSVLLKKIDQKELSEEQLNDFFYNFKRIKKLKGNMKSQFIASLLIDDISGKNRSLYFVDEYETQKINMMPLLNKRLKSDDSSISDFEEVEFEEFIKNHPNSYALNDFVKKYSENFGKTTLNKFNFLFFGYEDPKVSGSIAHTLLLNGNFEDLPKFIEAAKGLFPVRKNIGRHEIYSRSIEEHDFARLIGLLRTNNISPEKIKSFTDHVKNLNPEEAIKKFHNFILGEKHVTDSETRRMRIITDIIDNFCNGRSEDKNYDPFASLSDKDKNLVTRTKMENGEFNDEVQRLLG